MPPELLAHFKKKQEGSEPAESEEKTDKQRRKEAVNKARIRLEENSRRRADDKEEKTGQTRPKAS